MTIALYVCNRKCGGVSFSSTLKCPVCGSTTRVRDN